MRYLIFFLMAAGCWGQKAYVGNININTGTAFTEQAAPANGDSIQFCGPFARTGTGSSGTITDVVFRFGGSVTKAGGSTVQVSLQDADTTAGPPVRGDGTPDQSYTIANADASFATNTTYTATLGSTRTASVGEMFCAVFNYASYGGSDIFSVVSLPGMSTVNLQSYTTRVNSGVFVDRNSLPNVYFVLNDGGLGYFAGGYFLSGTASVSFNSGSSPDEHANQFTVAKPEVIDAIFGQAAVAGASSDFDITLYGDSSTIASCSRDANTVAASSAVPLICPITRTTLVPGVTYRISGKPTTTNNIAIRSMTFPSAGLREISPYTTNWGSTSRTDGGSWAAVSTTVLYNFGYRLAEVQGSAGGSFVVAQ